MKLYSQVIPHYFSTRPGYSPAVESINRAISENFKVKNENLRMLDLGAGFGVQALQFAAEGRYVTAVDSSDEMLALFHKRLEHESETICRRVSMFKGDWFEDSSEWRKPNHYDVIYALGNTVTLTADYGRLVELFKIVKSMLKGGGLFTFDYVCFENQPQQNTDLQWSSKVKTDTPAISFQRAFSQEYDFKRNVRTVTLHVKWITDREERIETESYKTIPVEDKLVQQICEDEGLVVEREEVLSDNAMMPSKLWIVKRTGE